MKHYWIEIGLYKYGDDSLGVLAFFGHEPTSAEMAGCFEGTHAGAWGNILRGFPAGGKYGEIIMGIKKDGFEGYLEKYNYSKWFNEGTIKNKSERHLRAGRRAIKRARIKAEIVKRLPQEEPLF
jgi:hypothetical protein